MSVDDAVSDAYASLAADIVWIILSGPIGRSADGVAHLHELTPGFPTRERLEARFGSCGGSLTPSVVWHEVDDSTLPLDGYWDGRSRDELDIGVAILPWQAGEKLTEAIVNAGDRVAELAWSGCLDRVVVVATTAAVIHDLENYFCLEAEMTCSAPVVPSALRFGSFRFMAAVLTPIPVGH